MTPADSLSHDAHDSEHDHDDADWAAEGDEDPGLCLVTLTFAEFETARAFGTKLVTEQLAACVQLIPKATSIYRWEGELKEETEVLVTLKTSVELLPELLGIIDNEHPYENPEFLVYEIIAGAPGYVDWLASQLRSPIEVDEE